MNPLFLVGQLMAIIPWGLVFAGPGVAVQAVGLVLMLVVLFVEY